MSETVDIVFRTVTLTAITVLATLLLTTMRRRSPALPGALFCGAVAAFFVTSGPSSGALLGIWTYPLTALCVTKAVWFWVFTRTLFDDGARLGARDLGIAVAVALWGTWQQKGFLPQYRLAAADAWEIGAGFGFDAVLLVFVLLALFGIWRGMATDLVERRRHLRLGAVVAAGAYLTMTLGVQTHNLLLGATTPPVAALGNMAVAIVGFLAAAWLLVQPRNASWLDPSRTKIGALTAAEIAVLRELEQALETERVFLQEGLTIGALAKRLGTSEPVLRRVINRGLGHRNFNDFLHAFRIREACEALSRPDQARVPVLSIAMDVGYGSIGAFNRAFKSRIGMTPTDFRRSVSSSR